MREKPLQLKAGVNYVWYCLGLADWAELHLLCLSDAGWQREN